MRQQIDADLHALAALPALTGHRGCSDGWRALWGRSLILGSVQLHGPQALREMHSGINDFREPYNGAAEWTLSRHINRYLVHTDLPGITF